jgi:hypothetical protein
VRPGTDVTNTLGSLAYQGGEPLEQGEWIEDHVRRSVAPGPPEP